MTAPVLHDKHPARALPEGTGRPRHRPVLLATLGVRIAPDAERVALEAALEADVPLIVANVIHPPPGWAMITHLQKDLEQVRVTATRAMALGIPTEHLTRTPAWRPVGTLLAIARGREVGLVVFGSDRTRLGRRRYRRAAHAICDGLDCLVWVRT